MKGAVGFVILVILAVVLVPQAAYRVDETQYVVITRFGEIKSVETAPGIKFKTPFVDTVNTLDRRVLRVDVPPSGFPDIENQFLDIDAYIRYRITDPRVFRETLVNEITARQRISDIAVSALREEVGQRERTEIIGGQIIDQPDGTRIVKPIKESGLDARASLTRRVLERVEGQVQVNGWGIKITDVRIKRADFPDSIVESAYNRMRSEREVQAGRLRAEGEEEFLTITSKVDRDVAVIGAEADEKRDRLRGEGEAEAINILAEALEQDPDLFGFLRSLETYRSVLGENAKILIPPDSELFQYLQGPDNSR